MPNWCSVTVKVTGPGGDLAKFREAAKGCGPFDDPAEAEALPFSLNALRPMPRELVAGKRGDPQDDRWYSWALSNWGVKWETCSHQDVEHEEREGALVALNYDFDTAWSAPDELILFVSEAYPSLTFKTHASEPDMGINVWKVVRGGDVLREEHIHLEYAEDDEEEETPDAGIPPTELTTEG